MTAKRRKTVDLAFAVLPIEHVGDSPYDIGSGKAAGVFTVGVCWGRLHPEERLRQAGADVVVHDVQELLDVL